MPRYNKNLKKIEVLFFERKGLLESEEDSMTHTLQRSVRTSFVKTKIK